jgi:hypothetical protein
VRFVQMMPDDVESLARAEIEGWDPARLAKELDLSEDVVGSYERAYREAVEIIDAPSPAAAFRRGVHDSIRHAIEEGLDQEGAVERLVTQIGYRAADLGFLLDMEGTRLTDYEDVLKEETKYDDQYWEEELRDVPRDAADEAEEPGEAEDD